ncbi:MAG TPA: phage minor head protein [Pyrinomonadaceae bacterium]|jgi:SPP1 gp7 family putative phage head morphogenesis protein|nr:phage minor head protein [Pyrinomonadaceae bacterium]
MSALDDLLKKHRKRVIDREEAAFRELLVVYGELQRDLRRQYAEIQKMIVEAAAAGEEISQTWLLKSRRLESLLAQIQQQVIRFGGRVRGVVMREQSAAIAIAVDQTSETLRLILPNQPGLGSLLPTRAIENGVGMMGNGSPMTAYFEKTFAPAVAEALKTEIIKAVATGTDFRTIARRLVKAGDITRTRALAMARTEVNRVRRATTLQIYQDNSDVISGWEWVASKSPRTCPVCLALDGSMHKLAEPFPQHINCRCTMIPVIIGVERPDRILGIDWFDDEGDEVKEMILGKDAFAAHDRGEVSLKDFVGYATSKEFGRRVYTKKLADVLPGK